MCGRFSVFKGQIVLQVLHHIDQLTWQRRGGRRPGRLDNGCYLLGMALPMGGRGCCGRRNCRSQGLCAKGRRAISRGPAEKAVASDDRSGHDLPIKSLRRPLGDNSATARDPHWTAGDTARQFSPLRSEVCGVVRSHDRRLPNRPKLSKGDFTTELMASDRSWLARRSYACPLMRSV